MLGKRTAKLRKERGWTQGDLANATRLSRGYIASIEEGTVHPSIKTVAIIAKILGIEAGELLKGEER